jgi:hypothetical protein
VGRSLESLIDENSAIGVDTASQVVDIKAQNYCILTKYVLTHIETALQLVLPSQRECEDMARSGDFLWPHSKIPKYLGLKLPVNPKQKPYTEDKVFPVPRMYAPRDTDAVEDDCKDIMGLDDEEQLDSQKSNDHDEVECVDSLSDESETPHQDICEERALQEASNDWPLPDDYQTLYERNNMILDVPLHDDLA